MGIGPAVAIPRALDAAGLSLEEIDLIELNEAFASQVLACARELGIDEEKLNVNGGAIALGHPLGCSGARLATTLVRELRRRGGKYGIATMCVGVGQGLATVFETPSADLAPESLERAATAALIERAAASGVSPSPTIRLTPNERATSRPSPDGGKIPAIPSSTYPWVALRNWPEARTGSTGRMRPDSTTRVIELTITFIPERASGELPAAPATVIARPACCLRPTPVIPNIRR